MKTVIASALALALLAGGASAQTLKTQTPKEAFGFEVGADYSLATYSQAVAWWKTLAGQSDRMTLVDIGPTSEGRRQYTAIITSAENRTNLAHYQEIARKLAKADGVDEAQARALAAEGKAVVWIDGGLHANEVVGTQQTLELVHQLVSRDDPEMRRILDNVIVMVTIANPDGMELVSSWYMRNPDPKQRRLTDLPRLYEKYAGHDDNRDFYASNLATTTNMNRMMFREWFPQIVYDHHQPGPYFPDGQIMFSPPFRDPLGLHYDPLVPAGIELMGAAMHARFAAENKPGVVMRSTDSYSTWFNGSLRTISYFHNAIGLLTESGGNPAPIQVPLVPDMQLPKSDNPYPVAAQTWRFRQSIDYDMTASLAVLDYAARQKDQLLFGAWRMGSNAIAAGSRDSWTITPKRIHALEAAAAAEGKQSRAKRIEQIAGGVSGDAVKPVDAEDIYSRALGSGAVDPALQTKVLRDPAYRDPRGYILSADQADFPTATLFVNALIKTGVDVEKATAPFTVAGKTYPAGSWIVKTAQAYRPQVLDMFEPQDHPDDLAYPGGPPIAPYDVTGYTLALQMGVRFDRVLDAFDGPFTKVEGVQAPPAGHVGGVAKPAGYLVSPRQNGGFILINRLQKAGIAASRVAAPTAILGAEPVAGAIYVPATGRAILDKAAAELGISAEGVAARPAGLTAVKPVRIALWDRYGGSMPSGWLRFVLDQFEYPYEVVYPQGLDKGDLSKRFDLIIFPSGAMPNVAAKDAGFNTWSDPKPEQIPAEYRDHLGAVSVDKTIPQLKAFTEKGGRIVAMGDSALRLAKLFDLPVGDGLADVSADGKEKPLPREKFYIPGSILHATVDPAEPLGWGMPRDLDMFFERSPSFRLAADAGTKGVRQVAWFAEDRPLRSGWALGQERLKGTAAVVDAPMGKGRVFLFGPEATFRAQPHGTYKLLFNAIDYGG